MGWNKCTVPVFQCHFLIFFGSPFCNLLATCPWNLLQHFSITWHLWWIFGRYLSGKTVQSPGLYRHPYQRSVYSILFVTLTGWGVNANKTCIGSLIEPGSYHLESISVPTQKFVLIAWMVVPIRGGHDLAWNTQTQSTCPTWISAILLKHLCTCAYWTSIIYIGATWLVQPTIVDSISPNLCSIWSKKRRVSNLHHF